MGQHFKHTPTWSGVFPTLVREADCSASKGTPYGAQGPLQQLQCTARVVVRPDRGPHLFGWHEPLLNNEKKTRKGGCVRNKSDRDGGMREERDRGETERVFLNVSSLIQIPLRWQGLKLLALHKPMLMFPRHASSRGTAPRWITSVTAISYANNKNPLLQPPKC